MKINNNITITIGIILYEMRRRSTMIYEMSNKIFINFKLKEMLKNNFLK